MYTTHVQVAHHAIAGLNDYCIFGSPGVMERIPIEPIQYDKENIV